MAGITSGDGFVFAHHRFQARKPFGCRVATHAFIGLQRDFNFADLFGFLVHDLFDRSHGRKLIVKAASLMGRGCALLALEAVFVHCIPAYAIAGGNVFCCLQHGHIDFRLDLHDLGVTGSVDIDPVVLNERNLVDAAADRNGLAIIDDLLGSCRHRHQARRTLAIQGHAGNRNRQAGGDCYLTRHVGALCALL